MNLSEEIKARLDIVEVISGYIALNPAGDNYRARCPFHNEKTASFMVSKSKQIWHCFGCNKGGDLIKFVEDYEGLSFIEAAKILATKANIKQEFLPAHQSSTKDYSVLYQINEQAAQFYVAKLQEKNLVTEKVLAYLAKRKASLDSQKKWSLGLSGETWDELYLYLQSKGFKDQDIFQAGLSLQKKSGSGFVDRFRKRLMFPLLDAQGKVVGFTSRTLSNIAYEEDDFGGKYINSPQSPIYDKSKILYGWDKAKEEIRRKKYIIVVEGNMDVIAAHQAGTMNCVAVSGTALTEQHLHLMKRYTDNLILSFDGDNAGSNAALRTITLAWGFEFNTKILVLPAGMDPADVVKEDPKLWLSLVQKSIVAMDFYLNKVLAGVDLNRADHKKIAVSKLLPLIKSLKSKIEQTHYLKILADRLNLPLEILQTDFSHSKIAVEERAMSNNTAINNKPTNKTLSLSEQVLALAFAHDKYWQKLISDLEPEALATEWQDLYKNAIIYYTKQRSLQAFLDNSDLAETQRQEFIRLTMSQARDFIDWQTKELDDHWSSLVNSLKKQHLIITRQNLFNDLRQAELKQDANASDQIIHQINLLNKAIDKLL